MQEIIEAAKIAEAAIVPFFLTFDRVVKWAKSRKHKKSDDFEKHVGRLYADFEPLGKDLIALFRSARDCLNGTKKEHKAAAKVIQAQRDKFAESRAKMRARAEEFASSASPRDQKLAEFVNSLASFFSKGASAPDTRRPMMSKAASLAKNLSNRISLADSPAEQAQYEREQLLAYINGTITELERSWYEISGRYEELKKQYTAA